MVQLDNYDVAPTDILLAMVAELANELKEREGAVIADSYFRRRFDEIKGFFLSEVEINEGELPLWEAKVKIQRLKKDPTARQEVRKRLQPQLSTMSEEINLVFERARSSLRAAQERAGKQASRDIVIVADSLDKIRQVDGHAAGVSSQRALFLDQYTRLTGLRAHIIYTIPLELSRSIAGARLLGLYGHLFVLPMVKTFARGTRAPYEGGIRSLHDVLRHRLKGHELEDLFAPEALEFLITYCGGHVRQFLSFVQAASTYAERTPIPLEAAHKAIRQTVRAYATTIPEPYWAKLKALDLSDTQKVPNGDEDYLRMLENLIVLEYVNGGAEDDPFLSAAPWYAVHPIVRELQEFKQARPAP